MSLTYREIQGVLRGLDLPRHYKRDYLERILNAHKSGDVLLRDAVIDEARSDRERNRRKTKAKKLQAVKINGPPMASFVIRADHLTDSTVTFSKVLPKMKGLTISKKKISAVAAPLKISSKKRTERVMTLEWVVKDECGQLHLKSYVLTAPTAPFGNQFHEVYLEDSMATENSAYIDNSIEINFINEENPVNLANGFTEDDLFQDCQGNFTQTDSNIDEILNDSEWNTTFLNESMWSQGDNTLDPIDGQEESSQNGDTTLINYFETHVDIDPIDQIDEDLASFGYDKIDLLSAMHKLFCRYCAEEIPTFELESHLRMVHGNEIFYTRTHKWNYRLSVKDLQRMPEMENCSMFDCAGKLMLLFLKFQEPDIIRAIVLCAADNEDALNDYVKLPTVIITMKNSNSQELFTWKTTPIKIAFDSSKYEKPFDSNEDCLHLTLTQLGVTPKGYGAIAQEIVDFTDLHIPITISYIT